MNEPGREDLVDTQDPAAQDIWDEKALVWRQETPEEAMHRMEKTREANLLMAQQKAELEEWRNKHDAVEAMGSALRRFRNAHNRTQPGGSDTFGRRPTEEEMAEYATEYEMALFEVQAVGDALREMLPEMFWPKGTPPAPLPLDDELRVEARALRARLNQGIIRINTILETNDE